MKVTLGRRLLSQALILGMSIGMVLALMGVKTVASREKKKFDNQLPDTLTLTSTSLRAGYSLLQAVEAVAQESPEPSSSLRQPKRCAD